MMPVCLFGVLVAAKALMLAGRELTWSPWLPVALVWQDVLVVLLVWAVSRVVRRPVVTWSIYAALTIYAAINVAVVWVTTSPLTPAMLRAAGGPLTDSIVHELTLRNLSGVGVVLVVGGLLPWLLRGRRMQPGPIAAVVSIIIVAAGPLALARVDTRGLHRTAVLALLPSGALRAAPAGPDEDWRASPFGAGASEPLVGCRGAARGQNVLLVLLESTAAQYLKLYGAAADPTPNLTRLGSRAVVFDSAYAVYPESIKELFAVLCSRDPGYDVPAEALAGAPCPSLAATLAQAGYRTALFHSGRFAYLGMPAVVEHRGFDVLEDAGDISGRVQSSFGVDEDSAVHRLLGWIDGLDQRNPFFATYLPVAGHHPYAATRPGPFDDSTEFGRYQNALYDGDRALGVLLEGLRARGLSDRTLVVIAGDHGEAFGQHDGNFGHTMFIDEENVRVPYVMVVPNRPAGVRVRRVASVLDTAPTILDLLGLPPSPLQQGGTLLDGRPRMALFFTDYSLGWLGLRDNCWKYQFEVNNARASLFDVCEDPAERQDRSAGESARLAAYRDRLERWAGATRTALTTRSGRRP